MGNLFKNGEEKAYIFSALETEAYWSKAEWELVITDTQPHIDSKELNRLITDCYLKRTVAEPPLLFSHVNLSDAEKIDVYEQVRLNWDEFVDYVWSFSKSATKR